MYFGVLRDLQKGVLLRINSKILKVIDISFDRNIVAYSLLNEDDNLEFELWVPTDENENNFKFFKIYNHGEEVVRGPPVGFQNQVDIVE